MSETYGLTDELELGGDENQFLTFVLNGEEYGLRILKVQEIKGFSSVTPIPGTPAFIKGVMNLRGAVVPVVDLRAKFGMPAAAYDKFTVIVVVDVGGADASRGASRVVGLVVDAVSDVLNFAEGDVAPPPVLGTGIDTSFLTGMAKAGEQLVLLLDIDAVVGADVAALAA